MNDTHNVQFWGHSTSTNAGPISRITNTSAVQRSAMYELNVNDETTGQLALTNDLVGFPGVTNALSLSYDDGTRSVDGFALL